MTYYYMTIPWKRTDPVFNRWQPYTVYAAAEQNFRGRSCPADVIKRIDGTTVYRFLDQYLYKFKTDARGPYVDMASFGVYYFTTFDPTEEVLPESDGGIWLPI